MYNMNWSDLVGKPKIGARDRQDFKMSNAACLSAVHSNTGMNRRWYSTKPTNWHACSTESDGCQAPNRRQCIWVAGQTGPTDDVAKESQVSQHERTRLSFQL